MSARTRARRRSKRRKKPRTQAGPCTYLIEGRAPLRAADLIPDPSALDAFLYAVGVHAQKCQVALHGLSYTGPRFVIVFTAPSGSRRDLFAGGVARDLGGYLAERFGFEGRAFELQVPVPLRSAESQLSALARIEVEQRALALGTGLS